MGESSAESSAGVSAPIKLGSGEWNLKISSDLSLLDPTMNAIFDSFPTPLDENGRRELATVLAELITNAIKWGNKFAPDKSVEIVWSADGESFTCSIEDQGAGFNPDTLDDPLDENGLLKASGRGVLIVRAFCDQVTYNEKGNRVTILKNLR